MIEPAPGASVGAAGVTVTVKVTTAGPGTTPPEAVQMAVDGEVESSLALAGRDGSIFTYQGKYVPKAGTLRTVRLWVWVTTPGGLVPSNAVVLVVDAKAPRLEPNPGAYCPSSTCRRDDQLRVDVWAEDDHAISLEAALDLDGYATPVPLAATGSPHAYTGQIALKDRPFPRFSGFAIARVRARDAFGNESVIDIRPVEVTRLRWAYDAKADGVTSPAVDADGTMLLGVAGTTDQLRAVSPDGDKLWGMTLGIKGVVAAPSIGPSRVWVGSDDGNLYGRKPDGSLVTCPATDQGTPGSLFTPAIRLAPAEAAYSGGSAKVLYGRDPDGCFLPASTVDAVTTSPVITGGKVFVATVNGTGAATIRSFGQDLAKGSVSTSGFCGRIEAPLAADASGVLIACSDGQIFGLDTDTLAAKHIASLTAAAGESIVILPGGDLVVGTNDGKVHRLTPPTGGGADPWTDAWNPPPDLGAAVTGVLIAAPDAAGQGAVVYAVTESGHLHALDANGATVWSTSGETSAPLGNFSLRFPTIAPALPGRLPTLHVGSAEGKLYAVVADTGLDTLSPWPKSHHDVRNTGDASAPLP
jgi:outer membrane protein assembly factor BamB